MNVNKSSSRTKDIKSLENLNLPSSPSRTSTKSVSATTNHHRGDKSDGALRLLPDTKQRHESDEDDGQTFPIQSLPKSYCRNNRYLTHSDVLTDSSTKYPRSPVLNDHYKYSTNRPMSLKHKICDVLMCLVIIFPLTIGFWRGIWQLMDAYSIGYGGPWLSLVLGNGFQMSLYYFQEPLKQYIQPSRVGYLTFYLATRSLLTLHSFSSVNQWRGLWVIIDDGTEPGAEVSSAVMTLVIGIVISFVLKVFNNVLGPPMLTIVDEAHSIHDYPLRFETTWRTESRWMYLCDCFFSVFVVQSLVIFSWRGVWNLADEYMYPDDKMTSALVSLGVGYAFTLLHYVLYPLFFRVMTRRKRGFLQLAIFDGFFLFGFISCVLAWRGLWELYNLLIVFETPLLSEWVTTIIGILGSALFGCVSSIAARGVTVDGDLNTIPEWPLSYISMLYQKPPECTQFPEPWIFRYFFTSHPVCSCSEKRDNVRRSSLSPLNAGRANSNKSANEKNQNILQNQNPHQNLHAGDPLVYPGLRNIDSSCDEEEMEMMVQRKS